MAVLLINRGIDPISPRLSIDGWVRFSSSQSALGSVNGLAQAVTSISRSLAPSLRRRYLPFRWDAVFHYIAQMANADPAQGQPRDRVKAE